MKHDMSAALAGVVLLAVCLLALEAECAEFILGGEGVGWTNTANIDYNTWLSDYKIKVGDTLTFNNYDSTDHSVLQVDKLGYDTCGASGENIGSSSIISPGTALSETFGGAGPRYYICAVPGHCLQGMKISLQIYNADGTMNQTNDDTGTTPPAGPASSSALVAMPGLNWISQLLVVVVAAVSVATTLT